MAFALVVTTVLALAVPFTQPALATHPGGSTLEILEEVDTNPAGTSHTLTAQLFQGGTAAPQNATFPGLPVNIDFEVEQGPPIRANCVDAGNLCSGGTTVNDGNTPGSPDLSCEIQPNTSSCVVTFTSDGGGTNIIRAFVDENRSDSGAGNATYDGTEGRYSGPTDCGARSTTPSGAGLGERCDVSSGGTALTAEPGLPTEPDTTDVVQKTWTQNLTGPVCLDVDPNVDTNQSGTDHQLTATVTNANNRTAVTGEDPDACSSTGNPGTARANVQVEFSLSDADTGIAGSDDPNAFFASVDGNTTNPSGGGPNTVTCTTDAFGVCRVVIRTVSTSAVGDNFVLGRVPGGSGGTGGACANPVFPGATGGTGTGANNSCAAEVVRKNWAAPGAVTQVNASPEDDTNAINTVHSVSASARNALGQPVVGQVLTFDVTAGPHQASNLDNNVSTPGGFFGQCPVPASGSCAATYTGTLVGADTITVCVDANNDFNCDGTEADSGNTTLGDTNDDQVRKTWVTAGGAATQISLDMEGCNGSLVNPNDASFEATAVANPVSNDRNDAHAVCAVAFTASNAAVRVPVTFSITGPGRFVVPSPTDNTVFTPGSAQDLGTTVTVDPGTCAQGAPGPGNAPTTAGSTGTGSGNYACAFLLSSATGNTAVRACLEGSTTICDTGTKPWTTPVQNARTVAVTPETASNVVGTDHTFTVTVTDRFNNRVSGVTVTWSRTGEGVVTTQETTTNAEGQARAVVTSDTAGTTTVTAAIAGASTDCDEAANAPVGRESATAGNCSDSGTKTWTEEQEPQCSNGLDDDGDGRIDTADPGCASPEDDSEAPDPPRACQNRSATENVIVGTSGPDILNGTGGRDVICGAGGNDTINGRGGNDLIVGNGGDDTISGGGGKDNLSGNGGRDEIAGNSGNDAVKGNAGNDTLRGNGGSDSLSGGGGNDTLAGGDGADALNGGRGRDRCSGGPGRDSLRACE